MFTLNRTHILSLLNSPRAFSIHQLNRLFTDITLKRNCKNYDSESHELNIKKKKVLLSMIRFRQKNFNVGEETSLVQFQLKAHISQIHFDLLLLLFYFTWFLMCPLRLNPKARLKIYIQCTHFIFVFFFDSK